MSKAAEKELVLITGGAGYLGSTFIREALSAGYRVRCLDLLVYGGRAVVGFLNHPDFEFIKGDIRVKADVERALDGVDHVVHMAAIVGDVPCQAAPKAAYQINFSGTCQLADLARARGVRRFIFASTCSNYGITEGDRLVDETSPLRPVSLYAETKIDCEAYLTGLASDTFHPISMRYSTVHGISYRTRFDLLINSFVYEAMTRKELVVFAANMWRPYIHVRDISTVNLLALRASDASISGQIFNAGSNSQNFKKEDIVERIKHSLPETKVVYANDIDDKRNYKVDFTRIEKALAFTPTRSVDDGIQEMIQGFRTGILTSQDYEGNKLDFLKSFFSEREATLSL